MRGKGVSARLVAGATSLLLVLTLRPAGARADGARVEAPPAWREDLPLTSVLAAARRRGRPVLILLVDDAWQRCATFARWRRAGAPSSATLDRFERVLYRADSREGAHVAERFHVVARPTVLVIDGSARELGRRGPPLAAARLLTELEGVEDGTTAERAFEEQLAAAPSDVPLQLRAARLWAERGALARAAPLLEAALAADPDDRQGWASRALLLRGDLLLLRGVGDATGALTELAGLRQRLPRSVAARQATYPLARALQRLGRAQEARAQLDAWAGTAAEHHQAARLVLDEAGGAAAWALAHARRALALEPRRPAYWATLAAVQRLAGDGVGARVSEARAFALAGCSAVEP